MLETMEKTGKKKHDKNEREDWRTVGELLTNHLSFTQPAQVTVYLVFLLHDRSLWFANFLFKKYQVQATWIQTDLFWCCGTGFFTLIPARIRYACFNCFALFPRLSPWQPWQFGTPAKVLPLFYPLGRFERLKTGLMGTNTPHTCIPGLVGQKQERRFSQFELESRRTRISHSLCMC